MSSKYIIVRPPVFTVEANLYLRVKHKDLKDDAPEYRLVSTGKIGDIRAMCEQLNNPSPPDKDA